MIKTRIFIAIHYLEIGGAEMSLIGLLHSIDYSRCDVDLFVYSHQGELMKYIPKEVNLLPEIKAYAAIEKSAKEVLKQGSIGVLAGRLLSKVLYKLYRFRTPELSLADESVFQYLEKYVTPFLLRISNKEYDLAVNFCGMMKVVTDKVKARKKITWLHTDYSKVTLHKKMAEGMWSQFDRIVSISPDVSRTFLSIYPRFADRIVEIENIIPEAFVRQRSNEKPEDLEIFNHAGVSLLSIGRFCTAKNYDNVPDICRRLRDFGVDLKWFIIGYGGEEELIKQKIRESGMEEHVILLGKKENPYPYIKACDIYVQPSRYEGKSVTVREAQMLCKPVVVTAYPTAPSQVEDGVTGVIEPLDNEGCARGLANFISNKVLRERISSNLASRDFGNMAEVKKIYDILGI